MKNTGSINGFILALIAIFGAYFLEGGSPKALFLIAPILIVFGGTFAAVIIGFGFDRFKSIFQLIKIALFKPNYDYLEQIDLFYELAFKSRNKGLLPFEDKINDTENFFTRKILRYVLDGMDPEILEQMAYLEIKAIDERHNSSISLFTKMGGYAPTMGILGTVMALIMTLANAGADPNLLIRNIATAFIATLWGVFSANVIWLPIGDKLKQCHLQEKLMMELSLEGALALQSQEIPALLRSKLISMLPQKSQMDLEE